MSTTRSYVVRRTGRRNHARVVQLTNGRRIRLGAGRAQMEELTDGEAAELATYENVRLTPSGSEVVRGDE